MTKLSDWLSSLPGVVSACPVIVTIGQATYQGAAYVQNGRRVFYLLGDLPASYQKTTKVAYNFQYLPGDWYIAGYADDMVARSRKFSEFHPYGAHFQIMRWDVPEAIDHYYEKKYRRMGADLHWVEFKMANEAGDYVVYEGSSAFYIYRPDNPQDERCMSDGVDWLTGDDDSVLSVGTDEFYCALCLWLDHDVSSMLEAYWG